MPNTVVKFNYLELNKISRNNSEGFIVLLFILSRPTNFIAGSVAQLAKLLNLKYKNSISLLILDKYIYEDKKGFLFKHKSFVKEMQTTIKNISFIFDNIPANLKKEYCYMLSLRHPLKNPNFIPDFFVDKHYYTNPYVRHSHGKLIFIKELI